MKMMSKSEQQGKTGILGNLGLVPLFVIILGGIMLLFALAIGTASLFFGARQSEPGLRYSGN